MTFKPNRGDCYRLPYEGGRTRDYTFAKKAGTNFIFLDGVTLRPVPFKATEFAKMVHDGVAVRQLSSNWLDRINIYALMDPDLPKTPLETRKKIHEALEKLSEAAMLAFYVDEWDKTPEEAKSKSPRGYNAFIDQKYSKAKDNGFFRKPSYSKLRRALEKGIPHRRDISDLVSKRGNHNKRPWTDPWVIEKLEEARDAYYSEGIPGPPLMDDVVATFLGQAILKKRSLTPAEQQKFNYPKRTAVREYILGQETRERLARRDPMKAQAKYGGKAFGASADFPLQHVQLDQTRLDTHINIYDEDGNIEDRKRPWLVSIFDVYSRSILAAILTFKDPSTYTVQLAIKQMLRPKLFLIDRFGFKTGVTDLSGQAKEITYDNGGENIGLSMRLLLRDAGTDVEFAPVATPPAKAIVERGFHTYNKAVWHNAPGGIPFKPHSLPGRRLNPEEKAQWALDFATGVMWYWICKVHQTKRNRTLEAVPARLWSEKINDPMVGRAVSKRLDLVDIICGERVRLKIDGAGVTYKGLRFHHPRVTEDFLRATVAGGRSSRKKVDVECIIYPHDCSHIYVVDHVLNRFVRLPNSKPRFADGLTWADAQLIRESDRRLDNAFADEEDFIVAKYEFIRLRDGARAAARAERAILQAKKAAKKAAQEDEVVIYTLEDGQHVEMGTIEPTIRGNAPYDVPQEMAAVARTSVHINHKDEQRNAAKAQETRRKKKLIEELRAEAAEAGDVREAPSLAQNPPHPSRPIPVISDPTAFLDALADDLD